MNGEEWKYERLKKLCSEHQITNFDISMSIKDSQYDCLIIAEHRILLSELHLSVKDIEHLLRLSKIKKMPSPYTKTLAADEYSRLTYTVFIPEEVDDSSSNFLDPMYYISLGGGFIVLMLGMYLTMHKRGLVSYTTHYLGSYSYETLSPYGALFIGLFLLGIGILGLYLRSRRLKKNGQ